MWFWGEGVSKPPEHIPDAPPLGSPVPRLMFQGLSRYGETSKCGVCRGVRRQGCPTRGVTEVDTQMKTIHCPPAISVFPCWGLKMFLHRQTQKTNQDNIPCSWHWPSALSPLSGPGVHPWSQEFCLHSRKWVLGTRPRGCDDSSLPLCSFAASVTVIGTPCCPIPACEVTAPTWAVTRWGLVSAVACA